MVSKSVHRQGKHGADPPDTIFRPLISCTGSRFYPIYIPKVVRQLNGRCLIRIHSPGLSTYWFRLSHQEWHMHQGGRCSWCYIEHPVFDDIDAVKESTKTSAGDGTLTIVYAIGIMRTNVTSEWRKALLTTSLKPQLTEKRQASCETRKGLRPKHEVYNTTTSEPHPIHELWVI